MLGTDIVTKKPSSNVVKVVAVLAIVAAALSSSFYTVKTGTKAIVLQFGAVKSTVGEGLHTKLPFIQSIVTMDVRVKKVEASASAASRDMQDVFTDIAVNYHVDPEAVASLYTSIGAGYETTLITPAIQECIKAASANYTAEQLIIDRITVSMDMKERLQSKVAAYGIIVDAFNVLNFDFSPEFTQAIEQKQAAEQLALKAKQDLERIKTEAEQKVVQAQAEAEALRIQKQEVTPEILKLREIEATLKAIEKWDGKLPVYSGEAIPFLSLPK